MDNKTENSTTVDNGRKQPPPAQHEISSFREALPQISAVCVKNVLLLAWGLTLGFPTILVPSLSGDDRNEKIILGQEAISWIGSINLICVPLGCLFSGTITQTFGRRRAMQLVNIPFMMSWLIFHFSSSVWQIFLALCLTGLSGGLLEAPVLTYVAEITQPHLRGILSATSTVSVSVGTLIQFLLGTFLSWRQVALINCCIPVVSFLLLMFVPETPIWLITKNRLDEARKSIAWLRGWAKIEEIEDEFQVLYKQIHFENKSEKNQTFMDKMRLFKEKTFYWPYMVVAVTFFLSHFNGSTPLAIYAIKIFALLKAPINRYYATVIMGCVNLLGCVMCMILINILGKRVINFISLLGTAVCFTVVASHAYSYRMFYFDLSKNNTIEPLGNSNNSTTYPLVNLTNSTTSTESSESYHWLPICFLFLAAFLTHLGIRILPWVLTGEVYTTEIRAIASGFSGGTGYIFNFISNKIFLGLVSIFTLPGVFWFYSFMGIFGTVVLYFLLPETEGKTLFEVTEHFAGRNKLRKSVGRNRRNENGRVNPAFVSDEKGVGDTKL